MLQLNASDVELVFTTFPADHPFRQIPRKAIACGIENDRHRDWWNLLALAGRNSEFFAEMVEAFKLCSATKVRSRAFWAALEEELKSAQQNR